MVKRKKKYKDYTIGVAAYGRKKGFVQMIHKRTGKERFFKI